MQDIYRADILVRYVALDGTMSAGATELLHPMKVPSNASKQVFHTNRTSKDDISNQRNAMSIQLGTDARHATSACGRRNAIVV